MFDIFTVKLFHTMWISNFTPKLHFKMYKYEKSNQNTPLTNLSFYRHFVL